MATYAASGNQGTISASYKGTVATWAVTANLKRIKWYEMVIGATGNPNATDTYIQIDVSRLAATTSIAGTTTSNVFATDAADGAALSQVLTNATTEPAAALISSSLMNFGLNQRNTTRWIASQESQYLISPATNLNGLYMRALSNAYTGSLAAQTTFLE